MGGGFWRSVGLGSSGGLGRGGGQRFDSGGLGDEVPGPPPGFS